jgi:hypothetical protein
MKIYLNNYDFTFLDKSLKYDNEYYNDLIYTPTEFLFRENDDYLWKIEVMNDKYETKNINNISFIIDYSFFNKLEKVYSIPKEHFHIKEIIYELEINDKLIFVKKILYDQINFYFEYSDDNLESFSFEELFNFIK